MARPVLAVIFGTFTLRLATGLTGADAGLLPRRLPELRRRAACRRWQIGVLGALFYASELVGSPIFGVLSDRVGHRRVMLVGPAFGAVAVIITAFTVEPAGHRVDAAARGRLDGGVRPVDPRVHRLRHRRRRAAAGQGRRPVRGRDAGGPDARASSSRARCSRLWARWRSSLNAARVRRLVPDLPLRRPGARRAGARGPRPRPRGGPAPLPPDPARLATSGCSRRRGSPSTRRSGCTRARRCSSSSASRTRSSRTSS